MGGLAIGYVPGGTASLADVITGYGRQKGEAENAQAQPDLTRAVTAREVEATKGTAIDNQIKQQQLRDQEIQRQMITQAGSVPLGPQAQAAGAAGSATPGAAPAALPSHLSDPQAYYMEALRRGMSQPSAERGAQQLFQLQQNSLKLGPDRVAAEEANHKILSDSLQGYLGNPNAQDYATLHAGIAQKEPELAAAMPKPGDGVAPTEKDLAYAIGHVHLANQLIANAKTKQETVTSATAADKDAALAGEARASTPGKQAESDKQKLILNAMKGAMENPGQGEAAIDAAIPPTLDPQINASYKAAYKAAVASGDAQAPAHIVAAAAGHAATIAQANNPTIRAGKVAEAGAVEDVVGPKRTAQAVNAEIQKAKLAPGAVSGILNPQLQGKVISDWTKAYDEYQGKAGDAQRLQAFIDAARGGNQQAAAMIPLAEIREIVNRVNTQELKAQGGASAVTSVENWLSQKTTGKPTEETLKGIEQLGQLVLKGAKRTYAGKVTGYNTLGAKFPVEPPEPATAAPASASAAPPIVQHSASTGAYRYSTDGGKTWQQGQPPQ